MVRQTTPVLPKNCYLVPIHKWSFCPISELCLKNNPRNITHMHPKGISCGAPAVIFFACLDIKQKSSFMEDHYLTVRQHINTIRKPVSFGPVSKDSLLQTLLKGPWPVTFHNIVWPFLFAPYPCNLWQYWHNRWRNPGRAATLF